MQTRILHNMLFIALLVTASAWTAMSQGSITPVYVGVQEDCIMVKNECATKTAYVETYQRFTDGSDKSEGYWKVGPGSSVLRCWGSADYAKYMRVTVDGKPKTWVGYDETVSVCRSSQQYLIQYDGGIYRDYKYTDSSVIYADSSSCSGLGDSYELVDFIKYPPTRVSP